VGSGDPGEYRAAALRALALWLSSRFPGTEPAEPRRAVGRDYVWAITATEGDRTVARLEITDEALDRDDLAAIVGNLQGVHTDELRASPAHRLQYQSGGRLVSSVVRP